MTRNPIISIIVPCYNQAQYLPETLDSVLSQTLQNWECVIVNDGSTDNTLKIANDYSAKDSRFIVIDKKNGGLSDARNKGIDCSRGKYILPLDSDDKIGAEYTEMAVEYLENNPNIKLVYCEARYFGDINTPWNLPAYSYKELIWTNLIFCSSVYRRSDYDLISGYDCAMRKGLEDWEFLLRLLSENDEVYRIPQELFFYRKHGRSMYDETKSKRQEIIRYIIKKHPEIYLEHLFDFMSYRYKSIYLQEELDKVLNSNSYKIGHLLIQPLQWLKNKCQKYSWYIF